MNTPPDGPRVVTRAVRPPRVVFIVAEPAHCLATIQACSLTWGGNHFCIAPYLPSVGLSEEWWRVIEAYDPDEIVSCVPLDEATDSRLTAMVTLDTPGMRDHGRNPTPVWDLTVNGDAILGQSLYSVLAAFGAYENRERNRPILVPDTPDDHPQRLYIAARYGSLNEEWAQSILMQSGFREELTLDSFVPVSRVPLGDNFVDFVVRDEPNREDIDRPYSPLLTYTLSGLTLRGKGRAWWMGPSGVPLTNVRDLLILTEGDPVEDFCWFWNLRLQRLHGYYDPSKLPLWLPKSIAEARKDDIAALLRRSQRAFILSKSVPEDWLRCFAADLSSRVQVASEELDRFYAPTSVDIRDQEGVFFERGSVRIPVPQVDAVKYCEHPQYHYLDLGLPDYRLPRLNNLSWGDSFFGSIGQYRVTRTGLSFHRWTGRRDKFIDLKVPTPWQMLETFADTAGYSVEVSDKGRPAQRVTRLVGGEDKLWLLSGRSVYVLFDQLAELSQAREFRRRLQQIRQEVRGSQTEGVVDDFVGQVMRTLASDTSTRVHQDYGQMRSTLGFGSHGTTRTFLRWLIQRHLIFRGAELACPNCGLKQWQAVDDIGSTMRCPGCQEDSDIPLDVNVTQWRFRANTLYARAHELGVIPHLLTLSYYVTAVRRNSLRSDNIIAAFPGIKLRAKEGRDVPFREIEIDVAWIKHGELTIGECKTNGRELTVQEIGRYSDLAGLIRCSRIVFAALDDWSSLDAETHRLIEASPVPVDLLSGEDLFDQYSHKVDIGERRTESTTTSAEEFERAVQWFLSASGFDS